MDNYFDVKAYSASAIKAGNVSMLAMQNMIENGMEASAGMRKGTLFHEALLEPEIFSKRIVTPLARNTNAYKAIAAEAEFGTVKPDEKADLERTVAAVWNHPEVARLGLFKGGEAEKELYWQEDGLDCKCKIDYSHNDYIIEYKSTGKLANFIRMAENMAYYLQLGWYWRGDSVVSGKEKKMYVVAQEQSAPFDVAVFEVPTLMLKTWFFQCMEIVRKYESGDRSGAFPTIMQFERPAYVLGADPIFENSEVQF